MTVSIAGATYLGRCGQVVLKPGVPLRARYQAVSGLAEVSVGRYEIDLARMMVVVDKVTLHDLGSPASVAADRIVLRQVGPLQDVSVSRLTAKVVRTKDGAIDLKRFALKPNGKPDTSLTRVSADHVEVDFLDLAAPHPSSQSATVDGLKADGAHGNWVVTANLSGLGLHKVPVSVDASSAGPVTVSATLNGVDVAPLVRFVSSSGYAALSDARADSFKLTGRVSATVVGDKLTTHGKLMVDGAGLGYKSWIKGASLTGTVQSSEESFSYDLRAISDGVSGSARGTGLHDKDWSFNALVDASVRDRSSLPKELTKSLPKDLSWSRASAHGRVVVQGKRPRGNLDLSVDRVQYQSNSATGVKGTLASDGDLLVLSIPDARFGRGRLSTEGSFRLSNHKVEGLVKSQQNAALLLAPYLPKELTLNADATVHVSGTLEKPIFDAYAQGSGSYQADHDHIVKVDQAVFRASTTTGKEVRVNGFASGPIGTVRVTGTVTDFGKDSRLQVGLENLVARAYDPQYQGIGMAAGIVTGPLTAPLARFTFQAANVKAKDMELPYADGELSYKDKLLSLLDGSALFRGGKLKGSGSLNLESHTLAANFSASKISLSQMDVPDIYGLVDIKGGTVSGSLDNPFVVAPASVENAIIHDYRLDRATAIFAFNGGKVTTRDLAVQIGDGRVTASGSYVLESQKWDVSLQASRLPLARVHVPDPQVNPSGLIALNGSASGTGATIETGKAEIKADDIAVFGQTIGSGAVSASATGSVVTAKGQIGDLDKLIDLNSANYNLKTNEATFSVDASEVKLGHILQSVVAKHPDWPVDTRHSLSNLDSVVSAHFEGSVDKNGHATVSVPVFAADQLSFEGRPAGALQGNFSYSPEALRVNSFLWKHQGGVATASGEWSAHGALSGDLSITNLSADILTGIVPSLPIRSGHLSELTVQFGGTGEQPSARGSATLNGVVLADSKGNPIPTPVDLSIYDLSLENGLVSMDGAFNLTAPDKGQATLAGLSGSIQAKVPVDIVNDSNQKDYTVDVKLTRPRPASILAQFIPNLDPNKVSGEITGGLTLRGRKSETHFVGEVSLAGTADGKPASIELGEGIVTFKDLNAKVQVTETEATLAASAKTSNGKDAQISLKAAYPDLIANGFSVDDILTSTFVSGTAGWNTDIKTILPGAPKPSVGQVEGSLAISGILQRPEVKGDIRIAGANVSLPLFFAPNGSGNPPKIDPSLDMRVQLEDGAKIDSPLASLVLDEATGSVGGRLSDPTMRMPLSVDKGTIRLPSSRIRIDQGSTMLVALDRGGVPRLDLSLNGHANFTKKYGQNQYQTYDLTLQVEGNLLAEEPLKISGRSEPVGLSQDEIQAFVSQRGLIESLVGSATGANTASDTQATLYSFAVPTLSGFVTDPVAEALHLDFLTLDYNPVDQTVVSAGKTFGRNLTLQFTRQLSTPINGLPREEIRLSYAFPTRNKLLSQFRLNLLKTQLSSWQMGISFGGRF